MFLIFFFKQKTAYELLMSRVGSEMCIRDSIWLDRDARAAPRLTVTDVEDALRRENVELPAGRIESREREFTLRTDTNLTEEADFRELAIGKGADGYVVRLGDIARVTLAAEDERSLSRSDGVPGVSVGITPQSQANVLEVAQRARAEMERMRASLPAALIMGCLLYTSPSPRDS